MKSRLMLTALLVFAPIGLARAADDQPAAAAPTPAPAPAAPAAPAAAVPAAAPAAAAPAMPAPPPEIAQLNLLRGTAHCTGTQSASQFGPGHPTKSVVRGRSDLGGFWMTVRYDERKTKQSPTPVHAINNLTYDPTAKGFVLLSVDNYGGHVAETGGGWDGDKLTLAGDYLYPGGKLQFRDTFTKKGDNAFDHLGEMQGSDGNWATLFQETCKR
jgi:hypothetical protein